MKPLAQTQNFVPADAPPNEGDATRIAEIVTFRLCPGISDAAFLDAARTTEAFVKGAPGFVARRLTRGIDGTWTDYVEWTSLRHARAAAEAIMADPAVAPFLSAIAPESVLMRHEAILMRME